LCAIHAQGLAFDESEESVAAMLPKRLSLEIKMKTVQLGFGPSPAHAVIREGDEHSITNELAQSGGRGWQDIGRQPSCSTA